jgi:hypothetical protein
MTTFRRRAHWRTSRNGTTYWVEEHDIDRDRWSSSESPRLRSISYFSELEELRAQRGKSSRFVKPNVRCPVCGQFVFFYQNEFGSKVFFDELGPPWPKHACTIMDNLIRFSPSSGIERPTLRPDYEHQRIEIILVQNLREKPSSKNHWKPLVIKFSVKIRERTFIIAEDSSGKLNFFCGRNIMLKTIQSGELVILAKDKMHLIDLETMQPIFFEISRLSSSAKFAAQLASMD